MPDNDNPTPTPTKTGSRPAIVISILFVIFLAGTLVGFDMCGKSYESDDHAGFYIFSVSALGLFVTSVGAFISLVAFLFDKVDSRLKKKYQPPSDLH